MKLLDKLFKKKKTPEKITEYHILKAIEENSTPEEFTKFIAAGGHKLLNSFIFFYDEEGK